MSVTKRVREYTDKNGKTKTYEIWRARVWTYPPHGERRQIEEDFDSWTAADEWEREQRGTARGRNVDLERTTLAASGLWERAEPVLRRRLAPRTFGYYRDGWNDRVLATFGNTKVGAISVGDVERAQAEWTRKGTMHVARQARYALSAVLGVAVRDGLLTANPARAAQSTKAEKRKRQERKVGMTLTPAQLETLVDAIRKMPQGERYAVMVDLMGSAGLRYGEAAALQVADVDLARGVMTVQRSVSEMTKDDDGDLADGYWREGNLVWGPPKGGRNRLVPVPVHLVEPLRALTAGQRRSAQVFRSERKGYVIRGNVLKTKMVTETKTKDGVKTQHGWGPFVTSLGFAGVRVHDLRATAATNLLSAGVPPHVVRDILGHEDIAVTNGYARSHDDALSLAVAALGTYSGRA
ncbi:site-specific recombinase XerD [Promicromonospora sp. AC04]|uniref:tyrosine-type recombinase/integrase n=1 Tax=Promicromonospora sp. AC04 TaxID=2135723 RepID=UPI000D3566B0|nr:site-specific integrase [Promicromonospora sp. AC04]PUB28603.1 site-specific recombinase XerD [Promicromonospora sp. AC04]